MEKYLMCRPMIVQPIKEQPVVTLYAEREQAARDIADEYTDKIYRSLTS
jgi:hypothetical protein